MESTKMEVEKLWENHLPFYSHRQAFYSSTETAFMVAEFWSHTFLWENTLSLVHPESWLGTIALVLILSWATVEARRLPGAKNLCVSHSAVSDSLWPHGHKASLVAQMVKKKTNCVCLSYFKSFAAKKSFFCFRGKILWGVKVKRRSWKVIK